MKSALILIDIQNEYFPGGASELYRPELAAANTRKLLDYYREQRLPVYHVQHISDYPGATAYLPGSKGAELYPLVAPLAPEKVFVKHAPNSFYKTGLAEELLKQQINHLVICGMMSHMCVDTTVRAAKDYEFSVTLIDDACTTKDLSWKENIIPAATVHDTMMASINGVFATVVTADNYLNSCKEQ